MWGQETAGNWRPVWATVTLVPKKQNKTKSKPKAKRQYVFLCETGFLYADLASPDYVDQDRLKLMKSTCFYLPSAGIKGVNLHNPLS